MPCVSWDPCGMRVCECAYNFCWEILADTNWCQSFNNHTHFNRKVGCPKVKDFFRTSTDKTSRHFKALNSNKPIKDFLRLFKIARQPCTVSMLEKRQRYWPNQASPQCRKFWLPDRMNSKSQFHFVVSFHLHFKDGWLTVTDFVIYWLLVSVVHQMNIFLRKNVPDIT